MLLRLLEGGLIEMLVLDHVSKVYRVGTFGGRQLQAVKDVSFTIDAGEIVSLIGESGSGKSTIGRMILRLSPVTAGTIMFDGNDISALTRGDLDAYYRTVQGVFQDPFSSYNPIFKVGRVFDMVRDGLARLSDNGAWSERVEGALGAVGLDPGEVLGKYPHQLSGGQLQRLLVARALVLDIKLLVADEIISMLDASTRIDVLNLLGDLKQRGLAVLFVTHDLSLGNYISDRTVILRHGRIVEMGATAKVFDNPIHPYTKLLLDSVPQLHDRWDDAPPPSVQEVERSRADGDDTTASLVEIEPEHLVAAYGR